MVVATGVPDSFPTQPHASHGLLVF